MMEDKWIQIRDFLEEKFSTESGEENNYRAGYMLYNGRYYRITHSALPDIGMPDTFINPTTWYVLIIIIIILTVIGFFFLKKP